MTESRDAYGVRMPRPEDIPGRVEATIRTPLFLSTFRLNGVLMPVKSFAIRGDMAEDTYDLVVELLLEHGSAVLPITGRLVPDEPPESTDTAP